MELNFQQLFSSQLTLLPSDLPLCLSAAGTNANASPVAGLLNTVKRVTAFCVSFIRAMMTVDINILSRGKKAEMIWVNTRPVSTFVVDHKPVRNFPVSSVPGNAVCASTAATEKHGPVPISVQVAEPDPTAFFIHEVFRFERCKFLFCKINHGGMYTGTRLSFREVP